MEDFERQVILFNHNTKIIRFYISGGIKFDLNNFETDFGKQFYNFYLFLNDWKEKLYTNFIKTAPNTN